ncbi:ead/Ea22-like family protein [Escherichia coli]|nr:ead/Ea22-like family protein [Escherichia coli]EJS3720150.1 ead/Ea22-like family protein [Escherichia coli]EKK2558576.1 ead/Ea22-like family protein [Escherichia coli]ELR8678273.1 ead/Ea22-like family protein [Escherichia coli]ELZ5592490.1 ead/Ea22-like family protein [Escherichia coli]
MIKINYQELREAAEQATQDEWVAYILPGHNGIYPARTSEGRHCGYFIDWPGIDGQRNAGANARYIASIPPKVALALLAEIKRLEDTNIDAMCRIAELEKQCAEWERKALSNFEECAAMAERIEELQTNSAPDSFGIIGENIRTQDNRITSDPMFCLYQKREIVVDADYDYDRIVWVDEDGNEANKRQSRRLELLHENFREPPEKWRRVAVKDIDEFVTCCFTEQGCKDYLAANGHNLRLPFIYVKSGFRNAEYIGIRNWLAGIRIKGGE